MSGRQNSGLVCEAAEVLSSRVRTASIFPQIFAPLFTAHNWKGTNVWRKMYVDGIQAFKNPKTPL